MPGVLITVSEGVPGALGERVGGAFRADADEESADRPQSGRMAESRQLKATTTANECFFFILTGMVCLEKPGSAFAESGVDRVGKLTGKVHRLCRICEGNELIEREIAAVRSRWSWGE